MTREEKHVKNLICLDKWMSNIEEGKQISDYLSKFNGLAFMGTVYWEGILSGNCRDFLSDG